MSILKKRPQTSAGGGRGGRSVGFMSASTPDLKGALAEESGRRKSISFSPYNGVRLIPHRLSGEW